MRRDGSTLSGSSRGVAAPPGHPAPWPRRARRALAAVAGLAIGTARAAQYSVSNEAQLRQAFVDAAGDPAAVIVLTANITLSNPAAIAAPGGPVTLRTDSFFLRGANSATGAGNSVGFQGGSLDLNGNFAGGNSAGTALGGAGLALSGGSAVNRGTISGGTAANGAYGVVLAGSTLTNYGTINGAQLTGSSLTNAGTINNGVLVNPGSVLINEGNIQTGTATIRVTNGGARIVNNGTIGGALIIVGANTVLELRAGSNFTQNAARTVWNMGTNTTLALGGSADATLDVSQIGSTFPAAAGKYTAFNIFQKIGTSTWTLTGTTGARTPWQLLEGTLSVSSNANLGGALAGPTGPMVFDGGALRNTAAFASPRAATINAGGATFETQADLTWSGVLSGPGGLTKQGPAALILTGTNTYSGGTAIAAGTLQLGNGGTSGSIAGDIANDGTLAFDRSDDIVFSARISGTGGVAQAGPNRVTLTADNTYSGPTIIASGTLALGDGGTSGSVAGSVLNNGVLAFNRSDAWTMAGDIAGTGSVEQDGNGTTVLAGNAAHTGGTTIAAGTLQIGDGGTRGSLQGNVLNLGTLTFDRADTLVYGGVVSGSGAIRQVGSGMTQLTADSGAFAGTTTIENGILAVNGRLCGAMMVGAGGTLQGSGTVCGTSNAGTIAPGNSIGTLTIAGDYAGNGGILQTEAILGGDDSPADRLVVTGNTSGSTQVRVINRGGTGGPTQAGIKIVDVGGVSAGTFTLVGDYTIAGQPAVVAGAYAYTLQKNGIATPGDGDWYLRSSLASPPPPPPPPAPPGSDPTPPPETPGTPPGAPAPPPAPPPSMPPGPIYQPGVPVYEAYPSMLLAMNALPSWQQRTGGRTWARGDGMSVPAPFDATPPGPGRVGEGAWSRVEGGQGRLRPGTSTTGTTTDFDRWKLQIGIDHTVASRPSGRVVAGLNAQAMNLSARIASPYGRGDIGISGYGVGATLTWYRDDGLYIDGQAQANTFDGALSSRTLGRKLADKNTGAGYAASVEAGRRIALTDAFGLTPQMQLTYSTVDFSAFTDPYGARVSPAGGQSLMGRAGVAADYRSDTPHGTGRSERRLDLYGSANLYYELMDGTAVKVAGTRIASAGGRAAAGVAGGGSYAWAKDRYAVHAEVSAKTGLADFGRSYDYTGTIGIRIRF